MRHVCINTECVNSFWGNIGNDQRTLFPAALCLCVFVCIKRLRAHILAWLCLQKGNQAWCPKTVVGANRIWANMQFMHARASNTKTQILGKTDTQIPTHTESKHIMHLMQTNKHQARFSFPVSLCTSLSHPKTDTHTRTHTSFPTENHHLSWLRKPVAYSSSRSFQRGMTTWMKEAQIKADLREPDSGLICQRLAVFRGCNALTPIDCRRADGEHFKC